VPEQEIRFCAVGDARVAYAAVGDGPALLIPALWVSHLELEWGFAAFRAFIAGLARHRTVIRYDRLGTGLSDPGDPSLATELETIEAIAADLPQLSLLGISRGSATAIAFAARHPQRVQALVLFGGYADGSAIAPPDLRDAMLATVRAHWGAGSRMLADVWLPGVDADTRDRFAELQRASAPAETAAAFLADVYATDVRALLGQISAPALVLHRRDDRAMPFALGRELASQLPQARLIPLEGEIHLPWLGDSAPVLDAVNAFLDSHGGAGDELSEREREVLRLVADGLSDAEIAERLIVSPHTVHRHVANIRTKLRQSSRAAAVAYAARRGLI
jgi:pimeloyl-ACP methyl ester carboxylesterase/DNA-binding CsgD family transcriptional regulator